jgi:hypothetical protein
VSEATTIGLDIAKHVFHVHGADGWGRGIFEGGSLPPPISGIAIERRTPPLWMGVIGAVG